jgi:hypothetical protein
LSGVPNTLTPAQKVQVLDLAARQLMPAWDNVAAASVEAGKKMGEFAMLNFKDRRGIDVALSYMLPFHYYWTRSAKNWMQRVAANPFYLDLYSETGRAIETENRQSGVPDRLKGTIPNPLANIPGTEGFMPERLGNPLNWILPFDMYVMGKYLDKPEGDDKAKEFINMVTDYVTDRGFIWTQAAAAKALDQYAPLPEDERSRWDQLLQSQQVGDYFPHARAAAYGLQAAGAIGQPSGEWYGLGEEFDPYLIGRHIRNMVQGGKAGPLPETAQYAQQMVLNVMQGKEPGTGIPPEQLEAASAIYKQAVAAEGKEKGIRTIGAMATGVNSQFFPQEEKDFMKGAESYYGAGYGPENLGGSKAARDAALEETPALKVQWGQKSLVPGAEGIMPPGVNADVSSLYDKGKALSEERDAAMSAAGEKVALAGGTNKEINAARSAVYNEYKDQISAVYSQIETIKKQYPDKEDTAVGAASTTATDTGTFTPSAVRTPEEIAAGTFPKGMNPAEFKEVQTTDVLKGVSSKFPFLGEGTPWAEIEAQNKAKEAYIVDELGKLGYSADDAKKMYQDYKDRNYSPVELAAIQRNRQAAEERGYANDKLWADRGGWVTAAYGADAYKVWDAYFDLPKDSAARQAYKDAHPELKAYNLAAYQPDGYKFLSDKYGADSILAWANTPKYTSDPAQQAIRTAYLDANPKAWAVNAWVNGRPEPVDPDSKPEYNYGKDYNTAEKMFGADIWDKVLQYRTAGKDERKGLFKSLGLAEWSDWWYGNLPEQERRATLPAYAFRGGGGRAFGGDGGGGGGGYGGGSGGGYSNRPYVPQVDPRGMDWDLLVKTENIRPWRKEQFDDDFLHAGSQLKPTRTNWR